MTTSIVPRSIPYTLAAGSTPAPEVTDLAPPPVAPAAPPDKPTERDLHDAYVRVEPECAALTPEQLAAVNVDTGAAASIVHASLRRVLALRDLMVQLPTFEIANLDRLEDYSLALRYADVLCRIGRGAPLSITDLAARATQAREALLVNAWPLVHAGIIAATDVDTIGKSTGYSAVADDVLRMVLTYRRAWPALTGRTLVTAAQIDAASDLATSLLAAVEQRDHAPAVVPAAVRNRQRIFTLFRRAYDEVRAAVGYLRRRENDADEILPSIYNRAGRSTGTKTADGDASAAQPAPPATPPTPEHSAPADDPLARA